MLRPATFHARSTHARGTSANAHTCCEYIVWSGEEREDERARGHSSGDVDDPSISAHICTVNDGRTGAHSEPRPQLRWRFIIILFTFRVCVATRARGVAAELARTHARDACNTRAQLSGWHLTCNRQRGTRGKFAYLSSMQKIRVFRYVGFAYALPCA